MPLKNNEDNNTTGQVAVSQEEQDENDEDIDALMDSKYETISRENTRTQK